MPITIDGARALELLTEVVEGKRDFVYESPRSDDTCTYQDYEGNASCGIGHALVKAGVSVTVLELLDNIPGGASIVSNQAMAILNRFGVKLDYDAMAVFQLFQLSQDKMNSWGEALDEAVERTT